MGLSRGPPAYPLGCEALPKAAPSIRLLVLGAAGILVCVMLLTGWLLWDARRVALEHAAQSRDNVAAAIATTPGTSPRSIAVLRTSSTPGS